VKRWSRYLVIASIAFLAVALYKADYLAVPHVYSVAALAMALVCLLASSVADAFAWRAILVRSGFPAGIYECVTAIGLSAFAKYIPGKVWALMGRAAYLAERRSYSLAQITAVTFSWQFTMLWLGLVFGAIGLVLLRAPMVWGTLVLVMWLALTAVVFSNATQTLAAHAFKKILGRQIEFRRTPSRDILASLPWFFVTWGLLSCGFYFLVTGLSSESVPLATGLGFPLSLTLGLIAFFTPGGLGVREGVIVGYLSLAGLPVPEATAVSIAARLWFLAGEVLIFLVGIAMNAVFRPPRRPPTAG
jgi:uncharacterized membrane protein YbhN (UPF0104 family)